MSRGDDRRGRREKTLAAYGSGTRAEVIDPEGHVWKVVSSAAKPFFHAGWAPYPVDLLLMTVIGFITGQGVVRAESATSVVRVRVRHLSDLVEARELVCDRIIAGRGLPERIGW